MQSRGWEGHVLRWMKEGKAVEFNSYPDIAGLMIQLGFMPEM